ncbi:MAG: sensor histidine kinase [Proteobacteria bacterium]|nr:MAG: sensor histidine kinase [Pseudomonadota bacterium]QKK11156.1 MAG: HAMP domain-containing histidine kinase [Pseudomonadota bacterium]
MLRTLYARLAVVLVLVLASVGTIYLAVSWSSMHRYLQEVNQRFNRDLARNLVADRNLVAQGRLDEAALKETFHQYMVINPSIEIYLLDLEGAILAFSADPEKVKRKRVSLEPVRAFLRGDTYPLLGDDPRGHDSRKPFSVTPVPMAEKPEGYLYVVLRGEDFDVMERAIRDSHFLRVSAWALAVALALGLVAGLLVFHLLTRRLERLTRGMEVFKESGFVTHNAYSRPDQRPADEIDRLGLTFDAMAGRISEQIEALQKKDTLRRDLVAQVSHDLRTPLASLRGYLETLKLKSGTLSPAEREEYLQAALRQSEGLSQRVGALFELAKFDAQETPPQYEPFSIAELVQDVIQKFQPDAEQRRVVLSMTGALDIGWVNADIAMIERVFDNLIENALRHTPSGGQVRVVLVEQGSAIEVRIEDSGDGIDAADLPQVFDRFYRGSKAGSGDEHVGLGLAIVKRILDLHGCEIRVSSECGHGTCFTFVLPKR